ncbi:class I SAM-dependent methyltransferase [Niveispirillum fermenti]|uniref:class I SAM-dependent methyltransferase n=1 Tax=Niveispirillum fermenti TaxID=1233113 RepID=UPI003A88225C
MSRAPWIIDFGAFHGQDARFYLEKGFLVLSVEANPSAAAKAFELNQAYAKAGRFRLLNIAIDTAPGEIDFFVHDHGDWSSAEKNTRFTAENSKVIKVSATPASEIFRIYGIPYYVKIDIEGRDIEVIRAICSLPEKPLHVSYELGASTVIASEMLHKAGYTEFSLSPQGNHGKLVAPNPPLEGDFVEFRFTGYHSGPFGREVPDGWYGREELLEKIAAIDHSKGLGRWWDVHARLREPEHDSYVHFSRSPFVEEKSMPCELVLEQDQENRGVAGGGKNPASEQRIADKHQQLNIPHLAAAVHDVAKDWKAAKYYDDAEASIDSQWNRFIWPSINCCSFDYVVDLACGHGRNTAKLAEISKKVVAIDVNSENVEYCTERFRSRENVIVRQTDGTTLAGVPDEVVSLVYCFDAMVHFDSDVVREYIKEIRRVLRVGGHAFLHHSAMDKNPVGSFRNNPGWRNYMSPSLMAHWANKSGLSVANQVMLDWRGDGVVLDCLTFLKRWK